VENPIRRPLTIDAVAPHGHGKVEVHRNVILQHQHVDILLDPQIFPQMIGKDNRLVRRHKRSV
jgi:hypothetical protein